MTGPESTRTAVSNPRGTGTRHGRPGLEDDLGPDEGRLARHRRARPPERPDEDLRPGALADLDDGRDVVLEARVDVGGRAGSTSHSWAPWRTVVPGVDTSECEIPRPAVMRLTSPGRTVATVPRESRCSTSPLNSHDTVARPQCGCGATSMPPDAETSSGP